MQRNFSPTRYWLDTYRDWQPTMSFAQGMDWKSWHDSAYERFLELLGKMPQRLEDMEPEVEYHIVDDGLVRERIVFNSETHMSVPCILLKPADLPPGKHPAILCSHGHGAYGKDAVAGMRGDEGLRKDIAEMNYNYGEQMARAGFVTLCPDLRGFGERSDRGKFPGRDECNVNYVKGTILGAYHLTLNIFDMMCCIDYLSSRPDVDGQRIGMMGLSQGGTMTTFTAAADPRIKAADIICYVNPFYDFGLTDANFCGSQVVPEIYSMFDTHDIAGLIAPRPLLVEMGIFDRCFPLEDTVKGFEGIRRIYEAAGSADKLWQELNAGPHAFGGARAAEFFRKYL